MQDSCKPEKIVLINSLSPGDILMMTCAIRSLQMAYPGRFQVDVRSPANEIFHYSPHITPIRCSNDQKEKEIIEELKKDLDRKTPIEFEGIKYLIAHYPEIHVSSMTGSHFSDGHRLFLSRQLGLTIPSTGLKPEIFFSPTELASASPLHKFSAYRGRYWVINAGIKNDYTLKWYDHYQEVVDLLKGQIQFVQVGHQSHNHPPLEGVIDMRGKTSLRQLFRLCKDADGMLNCVSMNMVIAAALSKPCVVVAGAREGVRWQINPDHQFLYRNGVMSCAQYDGCWKSRTEDCVNRCSNGQPLCMELIRPEDIVRSIQLYYLGGRLPKLDTLDTSGKTTMIKPESVIAPTPCKEEQTPGPKVSSGECSVFPETVNTARMHETAFIPFENAELKKMVDAHIFNILRMLKKYNPTDQYYEAYQWHYKKRGDAFIDSYHVMHWIGSKHAPRRVLEIGCRTGVSICQLLSSYFDHSVLDEVVLCDVFAELGTPETVKENLEILNIPTDKLKIIKGSSIEKIPEMIDACVEPFDYILVDGCHDKDYARQDLENSTEIIAKDGFILFDDLTPDGCSLQDVWDEFKKSHEGEFVFLEDHNGKGIGVAIKI